MADGLPADIRENDQVQRHRDNGQQAGTPPAPARTADGCASSPIWRADLGLSSLMSQSADPAEGNEFFIHSLNLLHEGAYIAKIIDNDGQQWQDRLVVLSE